MLRRPNLALAAATAALLTTSLAATPASAQTPALVQVSYSDLNLANEEGRAIFDRRIEGAARELCGDYMLRIPSLAAYHQACMAQVVGAGLARRDAILARQSYAQRASVVSRAAS